MTGLDQKLAVDLCAEFEGFRPYPYPDPASPLAKATPKVKWGYSPPLELLSRLAHGTQALSGSPITIGYGQTGPDVTYATPSMSEPQARERLAVEVAKRVKTIREKANGQLTDGQAAALASFLFNVGPGKFGVKDGLFALKSQDRPSTLWLLVQSGRDKEAADEFLKWINPPLVREGLLRRRTAERALYLRADA